MTKESLPKAIKEIDLSEIIRVDYSMEGDWNQNLKVVWTRENGFLGFEGINRKHEENKPCIEVYFEGYWLGIHCFNRIDGQNVFDEELAKLIVEYIEGSI